ncbi:uncharacterized protein ARB_07770 [Trichophyton benhamiae CBS 112371]|uniref:DUF159 domain protein n=1 Tax=Arthroderma benhamiae (strain ATCC MYA-4681 / CBS 112371) TaxID=663331 RepID=D4ATV7_ARTBC|nr:uncharacterized protein ARB_07770 [Trichophyton benhamiae CBS 112371]EFE33410.1 hypothetical protein ARB_07770 [Trichophyton benhamiae CBS 112371]
MCGRYAMGILQERGQQVDEIADDDEVRETYNFAPGNYGAVLRADTPDHGGVSHEAAEGEAPEEQQDAEQAEAEEKGIKYKIQAMKWGLIPFWTKRSPDYGSLMKTINCRDDSLIEDRGMWTSMKRKKRCIVICQGFYEWLKTGPGGKTRLPYYTRRKDGDLMCFAGLWDCVKYEDSGEKLYTYTVITTSSNPQLKFLHDRMPVILDPGSKAMAAWLDPHTTTWTKELQSLLKPYEGELETYPVSKDVGKVGNNSPSFIVPLDSKENKSNIANFFQGKGQKKGKTEVPETKLEKPEGYSSSLKREHTPDDKSEKTSADSNKRVKIESPQKEFAQEKMEPLKGSSPTRKMRSATSNNTKPKSSAKPSGGNQRITNFFKK